MELDDTIHAYHRALAEIVKGDAEPLKALYLHRDDVTVSNPWGPTRRGWAEVALAVERAASQFRDGGPQSTPHDTLARWESGDLAFLVENERWQARVGDREEVSPFELRVTTLFRRDRDDWRVIHRHADPITQPSPTGVLRT